MFAWFIKYHAALLRETEGSYTFSDGTSFTLTGGTIGTSDATWSTGFTAWKDGQPKDDADKQEKQDCVKVFHVFIYLSVNSFPNTIKGQTIPTKWLIKTTPFVAGWCALTYHGSAQNT